MIAELKKTILTVTDVLARLLFRLLVGQASRVIFLLSPVFESSSSWTGVEDSMSGAPTLVRLVIELGISGWSEDSCRK